MNKIEFLGKLDAVYDKLIELARCLEEAKTAGKPFVQVSPNSLAQDDKLFADAYTECSRLHRKLEPVITVIGNLINDPRRK